jgi:hypothetical protein
MANGDLFTRLGEHYAHEVVIARYCDYPEGEERVRNYALECLECNEVIIDEEGEI